MPHPESPSTTPPQERPILFSAEMVRAILDGTKTQTRRVIKPQPNLTPELAAVCSEAWDAGDIDVRCPFGKPRDRLWVRETWGRVRMHELGQYIYSGPRIPDHDQVVYRAGKQMGVPIVGTTPIRFRTVWRDDFTPSRWRPSIHMPRSASRITLEVTGVRVERLQDITMDDAVAEGVGNSWQPESNQIATYRKLWDSLNAKRGFGWDVSPWVWIIEFKRVEASNV